jgi:cytochrome P450
MGAVAMANDVALITGFDLTALSASFYDNPYPIYAALRRHAPVYPLPTGGYLLTRHADCVSVYKDAAAFSSDKKVEFGPKYGATPLFEHHTTSLVFNDAPLHTRVRRIIAGAFTPRAIADMEAPVVALVDRLLAAMAVKARTGEPVDLIADFAAAIPVEVIGNLLAVPHAERGPLRDWSLAILGALEPRPDAGQMTRGNAAVTDFLAYLRDLVARRRSAPGDPERDILTRLIFGERGETLSESELLHNVIFILNAGHETTTNLIGNGLVALFDWPAERTRLGRCQPDQDGRRGDAALRKLQPARQPHDDAGGDSRWCRDAGRHAGHARHRGGQSRSASVCRSRPPRCRPRPQSASGVRLGRTYLRRPERRAP